MHFAYDFDKREVRELNMGGYGSGRSTGRRTTSDFLRLDVRKLQREGWLVAGRSINWRWLTNDEVTSWMQIAVEEGRVVLNYKHCQGEGEWTPQKYPIEIEWTRCNYGGYRAWFRCPARHCGRRVAVLFGGRIFACRQCHQLAYESQREPPHYRALHRAQAIRMRLGGSGSMADPFPPKPKGMHRRTYWKLFQRAEDADAGSIPPWILKHFANR